MNSNLDTTRAMYAAFASGDIEGVLGAMSPDIHWTEAEGGPYGGLSVGPQAVLDNVFVRLGGEWEGFSAVPQEYVCEGATVVALGEYTGTYKATGKALRVPFAHAWKFELGKAVSFHQYVDTVVLLRPLQAN